MQHFGNELSLNSRENILNRNLSFITLDLILSSLRKLRKRQKLQGESKLVLQDPDQINPKQAEILKIEYKTISRIENISFMVNLKILKLPNNLIGKIEGLEELIHLEELDLSFNQIKRIENLQSNVNIKSINLHQNVISKIENLDSQLKLEIFICSGNDLGDLFGSIKYLARFVKLSSAAFDGNPIAKQDNYEKYVIGVLPKLLLLDFYRINNDQGKEQGIKFIESIQGLQEMMTKESDNRRRASVIEAEIELKQLYDAAFVTGFTEDVIWDQLYKNDTYGKFIMDSIADLNDVKLNFLELFQRRSRDLYLKSIQAYTKRENEYKAFDVAIFKAKSQVLKQCRKLTEGFTDYADNKIISMYEIINEMADDKSPSFQLFQEKINSLVLEYFEKLQNIWYDVVGNEMDLHEKIEETGEKLIMSLGQIIDTRIKEFKVDVGAIREIQYEYNQQLVQLVLSHGEFNLNMGNDEIKISPESTEKEFLLLALSNSHDHHLSVLDKLEQSRINDALNWVEKSSLEIKSKELERNKARLFEINHFVNYYYDQVTNLTIKSKLTIPIPNLWTAKSHYIGNEK